jgi:hypothetical protein
MVAQMTNETATFIMRYMPYARGLQWRTEYWRSKRMEVEFVNSTFNKQPGVRITG